jgi:hypothetical protein
MTLESRDAAVLLQPITVGGRLDQAHGPDPVDSPVSPSSRAYRSRE